MSFTGQDVIDRVRDTINDTGPIYRVNDPRILKALSDGLDIVCGADPKRFEKVSDFTLADGYLQTLSYTRCRQFVAVVGYPMADLDLLSSFKPGWMSGSAGNLQNWSPQVGDDKSFIVYPPADGSQSIEVRWVESPAEITDAGTSITVGDDLLPKLAAYCVGVVEFTDDEHVNSGRSEQAKTEFIAMLKGA